MDIKEIIKSAFIALRTNKLRTTLTMLGIIIGITSVILIYSIGQGAVAFVTNELSSFGIDYFQINPGRSQFNTIGGSKSLTFDDMDAIKNDLSLTNIKFVAPFSFSSQVLSANNNDDEVLIYGATHEILDILKPDIIEGEFLTEEMENAGERVIVLGKKVSEDYFGQDTSPVGETVQVKDRLFKVIGVAESKSALGGNFINSAVFIPINIAMQEISGNQALQEIDISVYDTNQINQTMSDVEEILRDRHKIEEGQENDFRIESAQDILKTVGTITGLLTSMIVAISSISLVVGGVGVMNIMLVSVMERTKEIGLLKAIGARDNDILTQFLVEACVLTLSGGIVGIILGAGGAFIVSKAFNIPFVLSFPAILIAVLVSTLVGIGFGLFPARRAAKLSPIDALRYE